MKLNLQTDLAEQVACLNEKTWTVLQTQTCMAVANAKLYAFEVEAERLAELVRMELIPRTVAADYLNTAAVYNALHYEYGSDHVQSIMAAAFSEAAA